MIITASFVALFVDWYNNRFLPLIRKLFLIPNIISLWISDHVSRLALISSARILSVPGNLCLCNFVVAMSDLKVLRTSTDGSAVCTSVCLTLLAFYTFSK
jgi:hypothetical protein